MPTTEGYLENYNYFLKEFNRNKGCVVRPCILYGDGRGLPCVRYFSKTNRKCAVVEQQQVSFILNLCYSQGIYEKISSLKTTNSGWFYLLNAGDIPVEISIEFLHAFCAYKEQESIRLNSHLDTPSEEDIILNDIQ